MMRVKNKNIFLIAIIALLFLAACGPSLAERKRMADANYKLGLKYYSEGNIQLAYVEFQKAIETYSEDRDSYYMLGIVNNNMGKLDEAVKMYKKALSIDPNFSDARTNLGVVYSSQKKMGRGN